VDHFSSGESITFRPARPAKGSIKDAKLPYGRSEPRGVTFHVLRHTVQTYMSRWRLPKGERQRVMGHATSAMADWYEHLGGGDTAGPAAVRVNISAAWQTS
jgi:integrase